MSPGGSAVADARRLRKKALCQGRNRNNPSTPLQPTPTSSVRLTLRNSMKCGDCWTKAARAERYNPFGTELPRGLPFPDLGAKAHPESDPALFEIATHIKLAVTELCSYRSCALRRPKLSTHELKSKVACTSHRTAGTSGRRPVKPLLSELLISRVPEFNLLNSFPYDRTGRAFIPIL